MLTNSDTQNTTKMNDNIYHLGITNSNIYSKMNENNTNRSFSRFQYNSYTYGDVLTWKYFPHYWTLVGATTGDGWVPLRKGH